MAGPRYSSAFHQYEGQEVEQQAQRTHSSRPSSLWRSSIDWRYSLPWKGLAYDRRSFGGEGSCVVGYVRQARECRVIGWAGWT